MKHKTQDPKFYIENNRLVGQSGPIPDDEPIFILRGRDICALSTLGAYYGVARVSGVNPDHLQAVEKRIAAFMDFRDDHPERMKCPDTSIPQLHDGKPEARE